jgi:hypothetical protein
VGAADVVRPFHDNEFTGIDSSFKAEPNIHYEQAMREDVGKWLPKKQRSTNRLIQKIGS